MKSAASVLLIILHLFAVDAAAASDPHLDGREAATIAGVSAGVLLLGLHLREAWAPDAPRWTEPPGLDRWITERFAAPPSSRPVNFMQHHGAEAISAVTGGLLVAGTDLAWPEHHRWRDVGQNQLLYWSGMMSLSGVQAAVKGVVGRQRPLARLSPDVAAARARPDTRRDQRSFWSGHASAAFYTSTFLNLKVRAAMRREMTAGEYRTWRWVSPTVLYSWATWVAWSRVHSREHWLSDVAVGAVAGWAVATLFEGLAPGTDPGGGAGGQPVPLFVVGFGF